VITDSKRMQAFYRKTLSKDTDFIPYGIPQASMALPHKISAILDRYGVEAGRYFLQITRIESDNLPFEAARAFRAAGLAADGFKFLVVGYKGEIRYEQQLKTMSGKDGIVVVDAVYDAEVVAALRTNCFCYIHGNSVGGTNPALLEAMASCPRVLAIDVPFSREVLGDEGHFLKLDDIVASFRGVLSSPDNNAALRNRVHSQYQWDAVVKSYMNLVEGQPTNYSPTSVKWDDAKFA
jgi:glycosyltransferase involved in cell wall biosynthesis